MMVKKITQVLTASAGNARQFICPAETGTAEEDLILLFQSDPALQGLEVVKLSTEGLPTMHQGEAVDWIANFGIREKGKDTYVNVPYIIYVTPRLGRLLVYFDGISVKPAPITQSKLSDYAGKIAVELNLGDPGVGWDGMN